MRREDHPSHIVRVGSRKLAAERTAAEPNASADSNARKKSHNGTGEENLEKPVVNLTSERRTIELAWIQLLRRVAVNRLVWRWGWLLIVGRSSAVWAGMPAPLPTRFTADKFPHLEQLSPWVDERLQALSFFIVATLFVAFVVRGLWNLFRRDWPTLPALTYRGALLATLLWGLVSVVVLTMISGARELMTPGAWRKQGWTYRLESSTVPEPHARTQRMERLESIRVALLRYAATHAGQYPQDVRELDEEWSIPAHPGFEFLYRAGHTATDNSAAVLVFEPELGDPTRYVLLVNGMIGTMRTASLDAALAEPAVKATETSP